MSPFAISSPKPNCEISVLSSSMLSGLCTIMHFLIAAKADATSTKMIAAEKMCVVATSSVAESMRCASSVLPWLSPLPYCSPCNVLLQVRRCASACVLQICLPAYLRDECLSYVMASPAAGSFCEPGTVLQTTWSATSTWR